MQKSLLKISIGLLMSSYTVFTVSCTDYDDDISRIDQQLAIIASSVEQLGVKVSSGKWVTNVYSTSDGYSITLADANGGTESIKLYNGKDGNDGVNGHDGAPGTIVTMNGETGTWFIDGKDTGVTYKGEKGDKGDQGEPGKEGTPGAQGPQGESGENPRIEGGFWWIGEVNTGVAAENVASYMVDKGSYWEYHFKVQNTAADGSKSYDWAEPMKLPKTATILNMIAYAYTPENENTYGSYTAAELGDPAFNLQIGAKITKSTSFRGEEYPVGTQFTKGTKELLVQVNPIKADLTLYTGFDLVDSKGNSSAVIVGEPVLDATVLSYVKTKSATPNEGFYRMSLELPKTIVEKNYTPGTKYAFKVENKVDYSVIRSEFNVTVDLLSGSVSKTLTNQVATATSGVTIKLDNVKVGDKTLKDVLDNDFNLVDWYFDVPENQTEALKNNGIIFNEKDQTITASMAGESAIIRINYLTFDGYVEEGIVDKALTSYYDYTYVTVTFVNPEL